MFAKGKQRIYDISSFTSVKYKKKVVLVIITWGQQKTSTKSYHHHHRMDIEPDEPTKNKYYLP